MSLNRREFLAALAAGAAAARDSVAQELPTSSRELWDYVRQQPVMDAGLAWLDTASCGPSLRRVLIEEYRHREALSRNPDHYARSWLAGPALEQFVSTVSGFIGAQPEEIAFTTGTTAAMSLVAGGVDLAADDEIVTTMHEHPAAIYPWLLAARRRGAKVIQLTLPTPLPHPQHVIETFTTAMTPRTRVAVFSHVQYTDGSVMPVRELCDLARSRGVLSVVDGAQALGMLPVSVRELGCDLYAASLHKWLNGPVGTGLLCLQDAARHRVWPTLVGGNDEWDTVDRFGATGTEPSWPDRSSWPASMRKYSYDFHRLAPLFMSVTPAIDFVRQLGAARIAARIRELAWYLRLELQGITGVRILTSAHPALWAGIVSFQVPGVDSREIAERLRADHRIVAGAVRHGTIFDGVRVSTHASSNHDDVDRLVRAVRRLAA